MLSGEPAGYEVLRASWQATGPTRSMALTELAAVGDDRVNDEVLV